MKSVLWDSELLGDGGDFGEVGAFVEPGKADIGASGHAGGRGASERIEHLPPRRSFGGFVNLLVGSLGLLDFYTKLWHP